MSCRSKGLARAKNWTGNGLRYSVAWNLFWQADAGHRLQQFFFFPFTWYEANKLLCSRCLRGFACLLVVNSKPSCFMLAVSLRVLAFVTPPIPDLTSILLLNSLAGIASVAQYSFYLLRPLRPWQALLVSVLEKRWTCSALFMYTDVSGCTPNMEPGVPAKMGSLRACLAWRLRLLIQLSLSLTVIPWRLLWPGNWGFGPSGEPLVLGHWGTN